MPSASSAASTRKMLGDGERDMRTMEPMRVRGQRRHAVRLDPRPQLDDRRRGLGVGLQHDPAAHPKDRIGPPTFQESE
jgi:hypothetical protein